jgi:PD-(D/E)XK nuclease superfamily
VITASQLLRHCGYPRVLRDVPPSTAKERASRARRDAAADLGTMFHAAVQQWVQTGAPGTVENAEVQGWIDLLASQWAPPPGTRCEVAWGLGHDGRYVSVDEPEPHIYVSRDGSPLLTAGRADAVWLSPGGTTLYVVDWKTGRWPVTPAPANLQVNAAGLALGYEADTFMGSGYYVPGIYYARDGVFDWGDPVEMDFPDMWPEIKAAALLDETPRPGPHCETCWERCSCAYAALEAA